MRQNRIFESNKFSGLACTQILKTLHICIWFEKKQPDLGLDRVGNRSPVLLFWDINPIRITANAMGSAAKRRPGSLILNMSLKPQFLNVPIDISTYPCLYINHPMMTHSQTFSGLVRVTDRLLAKSVTVS